MEKKIFLGKYRISASGDDALAEPHPVSSQARYAAKEIDSGRKVIVDLFPVDSSKKAVRTQLEAEAVAARQLNHINLPTLYDFGFEDDQLVCVSEYFDGTTAEAWVTTYGPLSVDVVLRIAVQVVSALGAAASHKIFHYAINPRNLLIVPGQTPEGDWPLVKVLHLVGPAPTFSAPDVSTARFDNTATFASPEQLEHLPVDFRSEVFSLGCTLWFLLTRTAPFASPDDSGKAAPRKMELATERLTGVPRKVRRLLAHMLAADPNERPVDPIALEKRIRLVLSELEQRKQAIVPVPVEENVIAVPTRRRFPARALALVAMFLAIATLVVLALPERFRPDRLLRTARQPAPIGVSIGVPETKDKPAKTRGENEEQSPAFHGEINAKIAPMAPPAVAPASQIVAAPVPESSLNPSVPTSPTQRPSPLAANEIPAVAEQVPPKSPADSSGDGATAVPEISPGVTSTGKNVSTPVPAILPDPSVSAPLEGANSDGKVAAKAEAKSRGAAQSANAGKAPGRGEVKHRSRLAGARARSREGMVRFPGGMIRARVIGTTPEGDLVLALPSHRVVIVPSPPPDF